MRTNKNQPCKKDCPNRSAECHAHCEAWAEYEKKRNEQYIIDGKEKENACIMYMIERDRKRDIATGRMKQRGRKK